MKFSGFDWDAGNIEKCQKHGVSIEEVQSLFYGPVAIVPDSAHSQFELRFRAVGRTGMGRDIIVIFTERCVDEKVLIRPMSARYMHKKEMVIYEKALARTKN
jgi:uncharacterized DUF497 family protein